MMDFVGPVNTRAPFVGFIAGTLLLGVTIVKAWQYFMEYPEDSKTRKMAVCIVCLLDCSHFAFSVMMIYSSLFSPMKYTDPNVIWSWKAMVISKALLTILVQAFYLHIIWFLASSILLKSIFKAFSVSVLAYVTGVMLAFCVLLQRLSNISEFPKSFEILIYIGFGSTAVIDCCIAILMSTVLIQNGFGTTKRGNRVVTGLILFFGGTGALTAVAALASISLYASNRSSLLYLGTELWVSRIYAISILTLFNAKSSFKKTLEGTMSDISFQISAMVFTEDPSAPTP